MLGHRPHASCVRIAPVTSSVHDGHPDPGHRRTSRRTGFPVRPPDRLRHRALAGFRWPRPATFNWGLEWFDVIAEERGAQPALVIVEQDGGTRSWTYAELSRRSDQVAGWLAANGVARGDRVVLMLGNQIELWEIVLAAIKLGAVIIPASTLLTRSDLADRVHRGDARFVIARDVDTDAFLGLPGTFLRIAVGRPVPGWIEYQDTSNFPPEDFVPEGVSRAADPLLLYFTSGTTALPKLVEHSQISYPIGHLSTMYWIGLQPGDVHLNISSPGWAKHAWSSVFAPWLAGATVLVHNYQPLRRGCSDAGDGPSSGDDILCTADGLADVDPVRPRPVGHPAA